MVAEIALDALVILGPVVDAPMHTIWSIELHTFPPHGLVKRTEREDLGDVLGKPSPELLGDVTIDMQVDFVDDGAVAHELSTGAP